MKLLFPIKFWCYRRACPSRWILSKWILSSRGVLSVSKSWRQRYALPRKSFPSKWGHFTQLVLVGMKYKVNVAPFTVMSSWGFPFKFGKLPNAGTPRIPIEDEGSLILDYIPRLLSQPHSILLASSLTIWNSTPKSSNHKPSFLNSATKIQPHHEPQRINAFQNDFQIV